MFLRITLLMTLVLPSLHASDASMEQAVLQHINAYRTQHRLGELTMNSHMVQEARQHSQDMAQHKIPFGHKYFMDRYKRLSTTIKNTAGGAENVAYNYKSAESVVKNWLLSRGHKANIDGNYNVTGVGIARDKQGKIYFTQLFLRTQQGRATPPVRHFF